MGKIEAILRQKLESQLKPVNMELTNESPKHGLSLEAEKHFRLIAVSPVFSGLSRIERHRLVTDIVAEELRSHVHAFTLQAFTPEEWAAKGGKTFSSPECLGAGRREF